MPNLCFNRSSWARFRTDIEEAEKQKTEMKSMIETQERKLQAKMTAVSKLDEDYTKLQQQCEEVKSDVQKSVDSIIASIEAKKQTIFCSNGRPNQKVT